MNTRKKAIEKIVAFLETEEKFLFLTGTHQNRKHPLALKLIFEIYSQTTTLFRINGMNNAEDFLSSIFNLNKSIKTGKALNLKDENKLYIDSINSQSWSSSPNNIDIGVIYPLDSLDPDKGSECIKDLLSRNARKIFLISWTDNKDFSWVQHYDPVHVIYDAEEEDPEYHQRVKDHINDVSKEQRITNLPNYAESTENKYLVKIRCRNCRCSRWAKLNKPYPGKRALREDSSGEYIAKCLKCGEEAFDYYNWYR